MALHQYQPEQYEEYSPKEKQLTYRAYQAKQASTEHLKEILFFLNVTIFSILMVCATYIYLSLHVPTFFAFCLAIATGYVGLKLIQTLVRHRYQSYRRKKRNR